MSTETGVILTEFTEQDADHDQSHTVKSKAAVHPADTSGQESQLQRRESTKVKPLLKQGHLRVGEDGLKTYKKTPASAIMAAIQLGIGYSVGRLSAKPERDVLMIDFSFTEKVWFPGSGSRETPSHKFDDFRFKSYAPVAFRYFRDIFAIPPSGFLMSLSTESLRELSNSGASGSIFFLSNDDNFIIKTVQHKEATFLQQLLPGYYMNLHQNPRTLLPKFFGLYCYQSGGTNIRLAVMNNLLPTTYKCHQKYDLKGSTYKRRASKAELEKKSPTRKDLDFINDHPEGIILEPDTYNAVMKTIRKDVRVLESFKIMDYSLLLGIHNVDQALKDKEQSNRTSNYSISRGQEAGQSLRRDGVGAALEAIQLSETEEERPVGGIPARNAKGERLILFIGIIDILQSYRMAKKLEHGWKSFFHDGDTVSVHKPSFYAKRFLDFVRSKVLTRSQVSRGPSKRRTTTRGQLPSTSGGSTKARLSSSDVTSDAPKVDKVTFTVRIDESKNEDIPRSPAMSDDASAVSPAKELEGAAAIMPEESLDDIEEEAKKNSNDHDVFTTDETIVVGDTEKHDSADEDSDDDDKDTIGNTVTTRFSDVVITTNGSPLVSEGITTELKHGEINNTSESSSASSSRNSRASCSGDQLESNQIQSTESPFVVTTTITTTETVTTDGDNEVTTVSHHNDSSHDGVPSVTITTRNHDGEILKEETHVNSKSNDGNHPITVKLPAGFNVIETTTNEEISSDGNIVTTTTTVEKTTEDSVS